MKEQFDYIILGAGIYGLYAARLLGLRGLKVALIEIDETSFGRASYINQARVHNGYHYPRSYATAIKSMRYFEPFNRLFGFAINKQFRKIYAISKGFSFTSAQQFSRFCQNAAIPCKEIQAEQYFKADVIEAAFETIEYSFDALRIKAWFEAELAKLENVKIYYKTRINNVQKAGTNYLLASTAKNEFSAPYVLNTTYASLNQVIKMFGFDCFSIKYEICEIILCKPSKVLEDIGLTVMDGPFFSVMPFGLGKIHSLTSVTFTPHLTSYEAFPCFPCQKFNKLCTPESLANCNNCPARPASAWKYMHQLSNKYLRDQIELMYDASLFAIKPILKTSELDDSRPTVIKKFSTNPTFISILSGKINTIFDLDNQLL